MWSWPPFWWSAPDTGGSPWVLRRRARACGRLRVWRLSASGTLPLFRFSGGCAGCALARYRLRDEAIASACWRSSADSIRCGGRSIPCARRTPDSTSNDSARLAITYTGTNTAPNLRRAFMAECRPTGCSCAGRCALSAPLSECSGTMCRIPMARSMDWKKFLRKTHRRAAIGHHYPGEISTHWCRHDLRRRCGIVCETREKIELAFDAGYVRLRGSAGRRRFAAAGRAGGDVRGDGEERMNPHEIVSIEIIPIELPLIEPFIISYGAAAECGVGPGAGNRPSRQYWLGRRHSGRNGDRRNSATSLKRDLIEVGSSRDARIRCPPARSCHHRAGAAIARRSHRAVRDRYRAARSGGPQVGSARFGRCWVVRNRPCRFPGW